MPEKQEATLKRTLVVAAGQALAEDPELRLVKLADGALNNWQFFDQELPGGIDVIDFHHACEHLSLAMESAFGEGSSKGRAQYDKLRGRLLEEPGGVDVVIRSLRYYAKRFPRRIKLKDQLRYFRRNRTRMAYAELRAENLPIGSGPVEAACKTVVSQRLKQSGMRWRTPGGQAVLTLRSWAQSGRYDRAWFLTAALHRAKVTPLDRPRVAATS